MQRNPTDNLNIIYEHVDYVRNKQINRYFLFKVDFTEMSTLHELIHATR